ncbi:hypothetical protein [Kaistia nematophila]|uniref:Uncharacterized protein n=1 Tax=Kaistia nematophila TaxID=2994654 RepID=A0A9X3E496_9HYPH|nr:hypothetical protein [Kaistia nematophila]MCX5571524.1 hypothetical protein [Kaistia nematophila]
MRGTRTGPARPTTLSAEDRLAIATDLAVSLYEAGLIRADRLKDAPHDIATYGDFTKDGRELGRDLVRYEAWRCDEAVYAALDDYSRLLNEQLEAVQARWAAENGISPRFRVGDRVAWPRVEGQDNVGTVMAIEPGGRYSVMRDDAAASGSKLRFRVDFEACRAEGEPAPSRLSTLKGLPGKIWAAASALLAMEAMDFTMRVNLLLP